MLLQSNVSQPIATPDVTFEVLRERSSIRGLAAEWDALLATSSCNRAFGSSAWTCGWFEVFDEFEPHIVVARHAGRVLGLLPLAVSPGGDAVLSLCDWSDYNDIIATGDDRQMAAALLDWTLAEKRPFRQLVVRRVRRDSCLAWALSLFPGGGTLDACFEGGQHAQYVDLTGGFEEYLRGRSKGFRKGLAKATRRARQDGLVVRELTPESDRPEDLPAGFLAVHSARFPEKSCFRSDRARRFLERVLPILFVEGRVRAFGVFADKRLVALDLCLSSPKGLCLWNGGFTADVAGYSPGTLLMDQELRQVASEGLLELDLLRGEQDWKKRWATGRHQLGLIALGGASGSVTVSPISIEHAGGWRHGA
jgi:CelD/BcsL family acetyltransferase involved in cellulose biosynthesis